MLGGTAGVRPPLRHWTLGVLPTRPPARSLCFQVACGGGGGLSCGSGVLSARQGRRGVLVAPYAARRGGSLTVVAAVAPVQMVNVPKQKNTFCRKCKKHTKQKVSQYKTGKASIFAQGETHCPAHRCCPLGRLAFPLCLPGCATWAGREVPNPGGGGCALSLQRPRSCGLPTC